MRVKTNVKAGGDQIIVPPPTPGDGLSEPKP